MQTDIQMRGRNHHHNTQGEELPLLGVLGSQRAREVPERLGRAGGCRPSRELGLRRCRWEGRGKRPAVVRFAGSRAYHGLWSHVCSIGSQESRVCPPRSPAPWSRVRISAAATGCLPHVVPTGHGKAARALHRHEGAWLALRLTANARPMFSVRAAGRQHLPLYTLLLFALFSVIVFLFCFKKMALSPLEIW